MKYISGITFYDLMRGSSIELALILSKAIFKTLKQIHSSPARIVIGDLNFNNILISNICESLEKINYHFVDFDSVSIEKLTCERIPKASKYFSEFKGVRFKINKNFDRLSLKWALLSRQLKKQGSLLNEHIIN